MKIFGTVEYVYDKANVAGFDLAQLPHDANGNVEVRWFADDPAGLGTFRVHVVKVISHDSATSLKCQFVDPATGNLLGAAQSVDLKATGIWRSLPSTVLQARDGEYAILCATDSWVKVNASVALGKYIGKFPYGADLVELRLAQLEETLRVLWGLKGVREKVTEALGEGRAALMNHIVSQ